MNEIINTGKFLFQQQSKKHLPVSISENKDTNNNIDFITYKPLIKNGKELCGKKVILAVHGMSVYGNKDPRFINVCKSFAGCGYIVISPKFDTIQNLKIDSASIKEIKTAIDLITSNMGICPESRLSIFTNSFSGSLSIIASSGTEIAYKVKSICTIGSYSNIENIITYLLGNPESDPYGRLIILKNFLKYSIHVPEEMEKALDIAIQDNFHKNDPPLLKLYIKRLSLKNRDILTRLLNDPYYRLYHWNIIQKNKEIIKMGEELSLDPHLKKISASILIIHGKKDNVIPSEESVHLFTELKKANIDSKLVLTPLLGHSNLKLDLNVLPSVVDLFNGLSFFFKTA